MEFDTEPQVHNSKKQEQEIKCKAQHYTLITRLAALLLLMTTTLAHTPCREPEKETHSHKHCECFTVSFRRAARRFHDSERRKCALSNTDQCFAYGERSINNIQCQPIRKKTGTKISANSVFSRFSNELEVPRIDVSLIIKNSLRVKKNKSNPLD
jgi:hypothetical protein